MATETFSNGTVRIHKQVLSGTDVQAESADQNNPTTLRVRDSTLGNVAVTITNGAFFPIADMTVKGTVNEVGTLQLGGGFLGVNFRSILDTTIANNSDFNLTGTVQEGGPTSQWTIDGKGTFSNNGIVNISGAETTIDTPVDGTGQFNLTLGIHAVGSNLTLNNAVGSGETINIDAGCHLLLSDTPQFLAQVNMGVSPSPFGPSDITLEGITSTSSTYDGSTLEVFNGSHEAASLHITTQDLQGLLVTSANGNTVITPSSSLPIGSTSGSTADHTLPPIVVAHS
jgi:hypothetical protein